MYGGPLSVLLIQNPYPLLLITLRIYLWKLPALTLSLYDVRWVCAHSKNEHLNQTQTHEYILFSCHTSWFRVRHMIQFVLKRRLLSQLN